MGFLQKLRIEELNTIDANSNELVYKHREILASKPLIKNVFKEFYDTCMHLDVKYFSSIEGKRVEIGSGSSIFKKYYPQIISTDIKILEGIDKILDAQNMSLEEKSVKVFYAINCFHHFSNPDKFFQELRRTLQEGGGCIFIEPYYGFLASFLYKRMHENEYFDKNKKEWNTPEKGPMKGANQALSYIIFKRDRKLFQERYPDFEIVYSKPCKSFLRYLVSGGLNFRPLLPSFFEAFLKKLEFILIPFLSIFALHHMIVIKKKGTE